MMEFKITFLALETRVDSYQAPNDPSPKIAAISKTFHHMFAHIIMVESPTLTLSMSTPSVILPSITLSGLRSVLLMPVCGQSLKGLLYFSKEGIFYATYLMHEASYGPLVMVWLESKGQYYFNINIYKQS